MLLKKYLIYKKPVKEPGSRYRGKKLVFSRNNVLGEFSCRICLFYKDSKCTCRQYRILPDLGINDMTIETFCCNRIKISGGPKNADLILKYHVSHLG